MAPIVGLVLSVGLFVTVLATGSQPVASAETIAPDVAGDAGQSVNVTADDVLATPDTVRGTATGELDAKVAPEAGSPGSLSTQLPTRGSNKMTSHTQEATGTAAAREANETAVSGSVSLGFEPGRSLQFSNWAGSGAKATPSMLVRMFGSESVCANPGASECVPKVAATELLSQFGVRLEGGRCEGMVAMAGLAFESGRDLSGLTAAEAGDEIAYWSLSQVAPRVASRVDQTRKMDPSRVASAVAARIESHRTLTLVMSGKDFAHAVLPVAVTRQANVVQVSVWDPNFPGELRTVTINEENESWSYSDAFDAHGSRTTLSVSGAGRLGFVENDLRQGEHRARFSD